MATTVKKHKRSKPDKPPRSARRTLIKAGKAPAATPKGPLPTPRSVEAVAITAVEWANIQAADEQRRSNLDALGRVNEDWNLAKETVESRTETHHQKLQSLEQEFAGKDVPADSWESMVGIAKDLEQAQGKFDVLDRKRRKLQALDKDLTLTVLSLVSKTYTAEGELAFGKKSGGADPEAWKKVEITSLMGEMHAQPFGGLGIRTVDDAIDRMKHGGLSKMTDAGEVTQPQATYLLRTIRDYVDRRGVKVQLPPLPDGEAEIPDPPKGKPKTHAEEPGGQTGDGASPHGDDNEDDD